MKLIKQYIIKYRKINQKYRQFLFNLLTLNFIKTGEYDMKNLFTFVIILLILFSCGLIAQDVKTETATKKKAMTEKQVKDIKTVKPSLNEKTVKGEDELAKPAEDETGNAGSMGQDEAAGSVGTTVEDIEKEVKIVKEAPVLPEKDIQSDNIPAKELEPAEGTKVTEEKEVIKKMPEKTEMKDAERMKTEHEKKIIKKREE